MPTMHPINGVDITNNMSADSNSDLDRDRSNSTKEHTLPGQKRTIADSLGGEMEYRSMHETKKYHRMIEKRRRDRINECIYQLKDLLPSEMLKTTSKPMEKAVILELVVQYMQALRGQRPSKNSNIRSPGYVEGFKQCHEKMFNYLESMIDKQQTETLMQRFQVEMPTEYRNVTGVATDNQLDELQMVTSEAGIEPRGERGPQDSTAHMGSMSISSGSLSSSPSSDLSLGTDNSDSSSSNNAYDPKAKLLKRKVFSHHRSSNSVSNQAKHQASKPPENTTGRQQAPMPVFLNMPFFMNSGIVPEAQVVKSSDANGNNTAPVPCMTKPGPVQVPGGMVVPQMAPDMNCGMQFPMFFVTAPMQQTDKNQQLANGQIKTMQPAGPMMFQPTMVLPVRDQSNFITMPSFIPMMPQFQPAPVVAVQSSSSESRSASD